MKIKFRALLTTVLMSSLIVSGCGANQPESVVPEGSQEIVITNAEKVETDYDCLWWMAARKALVRLSVRRETGLRPYLFVKMPPWVGSIPWVS